MRDWSGRENDGDGTCIGVEEGRILVIGAFQASTSGCDIIFSARVIADERLYD